MTLSVESFRDRVRTWEAAQGKKEAEIARLLGIKLTTYRTFKEGGERGPALFTVLRMIEAVGAETVVWMLTGQSSATERPSETRSPTTPHLTWLQDLMPRLAGLDTKGQSLVRGTLEGLLNSLAPQQPTADAQPPPVEAKTGTGGRKAKRATG